MARLFTSGAETRHATTESVTLAGAAVFVTTNPRSGSANYRSVSAIGTAQATITGVTSRPYYARGFFYVSALDDAMGNLIALGAVTVVGAKVYADGSVAVLNGATELFRSAAGLVSAGAYFMLELALSVGSGATDYIECRVGGSSIYSTSTASVTDSAPTLARFGPAGATSSTVDFDDLAVNDNQGSSQTSWPGNGKVVVLDPVSDSARGANWLAGAGATTNLWDAVDNTPPVGVVLASATNTSQVKNSAKDTVGVYTAACQTYSASGVNLDPLATVSITGASESGAGIPEAAQATHRMAQSFLAGDSILSTVNMRLGWTTSQTDGTVTGTLYADSGGAPSGSALGSWTVAGSVLTSSFNANYTLSGSPVGGLTVGATYWLVMSWSGGTAGNLIWWGSTTSVYSDGQHKETNNGGASWVVGDPADVFCLLTFTGAGYDTVALTQPVAAVGAGGAVAIVHGVTGGNPFAAETTVTTAAAAAGTFPTNWIVLKGTVVYAPVPTTANPTVQLRKGTSSTTAAMAAFMGLLVEYVPAAVADPTPPILVMAPRIP